MHTVNRLMRQHVPGIVDGGHGRLAMLDGLENLMDGGTSYSRRVTELSREYDSMRTKKDRPAKRLLSPAELEVARLWAHGWTEREIADARAVSTNTVHSQLGQIRDKTEKRRPSEMYSFLRDQDILGPPCFLKREPRKTVVRGRTGETGKGKTGRRNKGRRA